MGYRAIETLVAAIESRTPPAVVSVDVMMMTQANLDDESVQAWLAFYKE